MRRGEPFDVVVAGGGVAGSAAAAALSQLGYQVAVVEPGMDGARRLAGELVHHTGAAALQELGLLDAVCGDERSVIAGFSVRFGGAPDSTVVHLPYSSDGTSACSAFAMEHDAIRQRMLKAVSLLPGVTVLDRARITAVDQSNRDYASVTISSHSGQTVVRPRLLVGADGTSSPVSRMAGIAQSRRQVSTLFGFLLHNCPLPDPGYGHVFLGASGPVLAYQVSKDAARIMFDLPHSVAGAGKDRGMPGESARTSGTPPRRNLEKTGRARHCGLSELHVHGAGNRPRTPGAGWRCSRVLPSAHGDWIDGMRPRCAEAARCAAGYRWRHRTRSSAVCSPPQVSAENSHGARSGAL